MAKKKFLPSWALWAGAIGVGYLLIKSQSGSMADIGALPALRFRCPKTGNVITKTECYSCPDRTQCKYSGLKS
jgi:hypothetical protein